jgi:cell fate (sporulation/competence/biofilm development) regulator YlbF (YheA/YmcA/DUF963 family)
MENILTANSVKQKTEEFAEAILQCEEYITFLSSHESFTSNNEVQELLRTFRSKRNDLYGNRFSPTLMDELKDLQEKINNNAVIQEYEAAQSDLVELLKRTNTIISGNIGIQFAYTEKGGSCCG